MIHRYYLSILLILCSIATAFAQISLTSSTEQNTECNGFGCNYSGPSILINEVMIRPVSGNGSIYGWEPGSSASARQGEWIELYNPDICQSVDVSCYFLGNCAHDGSPLQYYGAGYEIPQGTIVPPRGFVIVRGVNAPAVPPALLIQNGGKTVELVISNTSAVCLDGGYRMWFPDAGGWFAFYDDEGIPQDAISWYNPMALELSDSPCNPTGSCPYSGTLSSYNSIPSNRKTYIYSSTPSLGQSVRRIPDGGPWMVNTTASATYGNCNSTCIPPPVITCNGTATVSASGGTPPYSYEWSDGQAQSTPTATGLCGGLYCVTVTDALNDSSTICVSVPDYKPEVSMSSLSDVCISASPFPLTGGSPPGGKYLGEGIVNNIFSPSLAGPGTHWIRYRYANQDSCWSMDSTQITVHSLPTVSLPAFQPLCFNSAPLSLNMAEPSGGIYSGIGVTGNYFFPAVAGVGTYAITYTFIDNNSCQNTAVQNITVTPIPMASAGLDQTICPGHTAELGEPAVPGNSYSWTSQPPGFTSTLSDPVVSPLVTTQYTLTEVINATQCSQTHSVTVQVTAGPVVNAGSDQGICPGGTATIGSSPIAGYTYSWSSIPAGFSSTVANPSVSPAVTTVYQVTATTVDGCIGTSQVTVTVHPVPQAITGNNTGICSGSSTTIGIPAVAGNTYLWSSLPAGFSSTLANPTVSPSVTTSYFLTVTNAFGCSGASQVTVSILPLPAAYTGPGQSLCSGGHATIGGPPVSGNTYSWISAPPGFQSQVSNPVVYPSATTVYTLTETNLATGCSNSHSVTIVVNPLPQVSLQPFTPVCKNASPFLLSGGNPAGGTYSGPGVSNNVFNPTSLNPGLYLISYIYFNTYGCMGVAYQQIQVLNKPRISGTLVYMNTASTPLDSSKIRLFTQQNVLVDSATTGNNGSFAMNCLNPGNYKLRTTVPKKWGGGNSIDALLIARFSVGMISLTPMQQMVADVNASGSLNSGDSYLIMRRYVGITTSFPFGDWYAEPVDTLLITTNDLTIALHAACFGDVNFSYVPFTGMKSGIGSIKPWMSATLQDILLTRLPGSEKKGLIPRQ